MSNLFSKLEKPTKYPQYNEHQSKLERPKLISLVVKQDLILKSEEYYLEGWSWWV